MTLQQCQTYRAILHCHIYPLCQVIDMCCSVIGFSKHPTLRCYYSSVGWVTITTYMAGFLTSIIQFIISHGQTCAKWSLLEYKIMSACKLHDINILPSSCTVCARYVTAHPILLYIISCRTHIILVVSTQHLPCWLCSSVGLASTTMSCDQAPCIHYLGHHRSLIQEQTCIRS